ncbi:MAG: type I-B CRISPR-associated protein Cas8b1/Cst1, partial [Bacteroidetes bacterium CG_4_10_14_3_um_filter_31_20]
ITRLNLAKRSFELRMFLLTLIKENFNKGNKKPLITIEEYVEYLFPDGTIWSEIRDLLLIAIYQKLHEKNISFEIEIPETELETIKEE